MPKVMLLWYEAGTVPVSDGHHRAWCMASHLLLSPPRARPPPVPARAWLRRDYRTRDGAAARHSATTGWSGAVAPGRKCQDDPGYRRLGV